MQVGIRRENRALTVESLSRRHGLGAKAVIDDHESTWVLSAHSAGHDFQCSMFCGSRSLPWISEIEESDHSLYATRREIAREIEIRSLFSSSPSSPIPLFSSVAEILVCSRNREWKWMENKTPCWGDSLMMGGITWAAKNQDHPLTNCTRRLILVPFIMMKKEKT